MNKSFKSVLNRSTGTYVAASENVKSSGKSAKSKLAMKLASASLALGASIAMLSSGDVMADDSAPVSTYQADVPDAADGAVDQSSVAEADAAQAPALPTIVTPPAPGGRMLGAQQGMLGASQVADPTAYIAMGALSHTAYLSAGFADSAPSLPTDGSGTGSIVIGGGSVAGNGNSTVLGTQAVASGIGGTVIGYQAINTAAYGVAIGQQASAANYAVSLGISATAGGSSSIAIGAQATASGSASMAIGGSARATASSAIALGTNSTADRANTVSVGSTGNARQIVNVAAGTSATDAVNFAQLQATGLKVDTNGVATNAFVAYDSTSKSVATLGGTAGTKITNVAAGDVSSATSTDAVNGSQLYATNQNVATNTTNIAANTADIVTNTTAIAANTADITTNTTDITANTADIATNTTAITANSADITTNTTDIAANTADIKTNVTAIAANTADITTNTTAIAANTADIKTNVTDIAANTADITTNTAAIAQHTSDISAINTQVGTLNTQIADAVRYDGTAHDTITLGGTTGTKIKNLAAGDISSATSKDAVNGSQLYATNQNVAQNTTAIAQNASDIAAINTQVSGGVSYDDAAHDTITLAGTTGTKIKNVAAGDISSATSMDAVNGSQLYATNQNVAQNTTAIATNTADITTNTTAIAQNASDIAAINTQVSGGVAYDSAAHDTITLAGTTGTKIKNVAAGDISSATSMDAVNGSQLYATNQNVAQNTTAIAANRADITANTTAIATNVSSIGTLNTQMADTAKYDDAGHGSMTLGGTAGTVIKNVAAGQMTAQSTEAVNGSQLFAVQQSVGDQSAILGDTVRYDSASHDKITLGNAGTPVALTNVKAGDVSASSLDAVNGSQLYTVTQNVTQNTTDIASLNASMNELSDGTAGLVLQDATTKALTIGANTGGGTVSLAGLDGARVLTGVANGAVSRSSSEALNGSQLFNASTSVAAAFGGGASVDANGGVTAPSYTVGGKQVSDVGSAVSNLDGRVTQNSADIAGIKGDLADVSKSAANAVAYDSADHSKVTLGGTDSGAAVQLTNVAAGDVSDTSTDAVNGSQLNATNDRVSAAEAAIANIDVSSLGGSTATGQDASATGKDATASGDNSTAAGSNSTASGDNSTAAGSNATASGNNSTAAGSNATASGDSSVAFGGNASASGSNAMAMGANSVASGDNSVALGANSVADEANTVSVGSAGNERRVTNVAPGVNGTDATNVNQLNALRSDVSNSLSSMQRSAFGGVAAAMAMPNLMPSSPGKTVVGAGVANYKGYNAFAAGATYRSENSKWLMNAAVSVTPQGDTGVRAQAGYEF